MHEDTQKDYSVLIAKKSEKLVTALYLVTDLMDDQEPIKHGLRKNAVALLASMNSLAQLDVKDRVIELKMSLKSVTEVNSLLHVSVTTGIVSQMNGRLLIEGFRSLQLVLEKKQPIFTKEMLYVENEEELEKQGVFSSAVTSTSYDALTPLSLARLHDSSQDLRRTQDALRQSQLLNKLGATKSHQGLKTTGSVDGITESKKDETVQQDTRIFPQGSTHNVLMEHVARPVTTFSSSFQMKKMSRRDQILSLFVKGVDISIKDISAKIKGCSEKTIQRELNALLYDNIIERIGEKRWSRYVLK